MSMTNEHDVKVQMELPVVVNAPSYVRVDLV